MHMRSAVKLVVVLASIAIGTTACASKRTDLLKAEEAKATREAEVDSAHRREVYLKCVLDDATASARDPSADELAPGDVADLSLTKCRSLLKDADEDFGLELFSSGDDVTHATATANRTADVLRKRAHDQAVAQIIDVRRKRSAAPVTAAAASS